MGSPAPRWVGGLRSLGAGTGEPGLVVLDAWGLAGSLSLSPHGSLCVLMEGGRGAQHFHSPIWEVVLLPFSWASLSRQSEMQMGGLRSTDGRVTSPLRKSKGTGSLLWKQNLPPGPHIDFPVNGL